MIQRLSENRTMSFCILKFCDYRTNFTKVKSVKPKRDMKTIIDKYIIFPNDPNDIATGSSADREKKV